MKTEIPQGLNHSEDNHSKKLEKRKNVRSFPHGWSLEALILNRSKHAVNTAYHPFIMSCAAFLCMSLVWNSYYWGIVWQCFYHIHCDFTIPDVASEGWEELFLQNANRKQALELQGDDKQNVTSDWEIMSRLIRLTAVQDDILMSSPAGPSKSLASGSGP